MEMIQVNNYTTDNFLSQDIINTTVSEMKLKNYQNN